MKVRFYKEDYFSHEDLKSSSPSLINGLYENSCRHLIVPSIWLVFCMLIASNQSNEGLSIVHVMLQNNESGHEGMILKYALTYLFIF